MATGAIDRRLDVPGFLEFLTHFRLVLAFGFGGPVEIGYFIHGSKMFLRSAVAVQTPSHALAFVMEDYRHFVNLSVAAHTGDAGGHVDTVIKVGVIGSVVNFHPLDRFPCFDTFLDEGDVRGVRLYMLVTIPAGAAGRNVGMAGFLYEAMTITAIHSQLSGMDLVRKRNRLRRHVTNAGVFLRKIIGHAPRDAGTQKEEANKELQGQCIGPAGKRIGHFQSRVWMDRRGL